MLRRSRPWSCPCATARRGGATRKKPGRRRRSRPRTGCSSRCSRMTRWTRLRFTALAELPGLAIAATIRVPSVGFARATSTIAGVDPGAASEAGLRRTPCRGAVDRLAADAGHPGHDGRAVSVGDQLAGPGRHAPSLPVPQEFPRNLQLIRLAPERPLELRHPLPAAPSISASSGEPFSSRPSPTPPCRPPAADRATGSRASRKSRAHGTHHEPSDRHVAQPARSRPSRPASRTPYCFFSLIPLLEDQSDHHPKPSAQGNRQPSRGPRQVAWSPTTCRWSHSPSGELPPPRRRSGDRGRARIAG